MTPNVHNFFLQKTDEELFAEEIKRVMREGYKDLEDERKKLQAQASKVKLENMYNNSKSVPINNNSKIKLRWNAMSEWKQTDNNTYTAKSLRMIFSKYGDVKEVVLSVSSTPRKGSSSINTKHLNIHCLIIVKKIECKKY